MKLASGDTMTWVGVIASGSAYRPSCDSEPSAWTEYAPTWLAPDWYITYRKPLRKARLVGVEPRVLVAFLSVRSPVPWSIENTETDASPALTANSSVLSVLTMTLF